VMPTNHFQEGLLTQSKRLGRAAGLRPATK
jgi:hypothetical protein